MGFVVWDLVVLHNKGPPALNVSHRYPQMGGPDSWRTLFRIEGI